jgi:NitT/TauT family transport system substrate-binding protein
MKENRKRMEWVGIGKVLAWMGVVSLMAVGCGGGGDSDSGSAGDGGDGSSAKPLLVAYSDWPGWVAWEIALQKKWFEEEGVDVDFKWFEYVPSMEAFAAGQVDAVCMTNGDALVTGAAGGANVAILINDYSNGNDMVVAQPGIESIADLKGRKIGVEEGFVGHLLLLNGLEKAGLSESDVTLQNVPTDQTPQTLASGEVSAIVAWQPNSGQALKEVPGSKAVYTSADEPGLIYDCLCVTPSSLTTRRAEWAKVVKVWYRIVDYMADPANKDEALKILSARVNLTPDQYEPLLAGTRILSLEEAKAAFVKADGFTSIYGSSKVVDDFNLANKVYEEAQDIDAYYDPSVVGGL